MSKVTYVLRFGAFLIYAYIFFQIYSRLSIDVWNFVVISQVLSRWYAVFGFLFGSFLETTILNFIYVFSSILYRVSGGVIQPYNTYVNGITSFLQTYWGYPTQIPDEIMQLFMTATDPLALIQSIVVYMLEPFYYSFYPILVIGSIFAILAFIYNGDSRTALGAYAMVQGLVIVASFQILPYINRKINLGFRTPSLIFPEFFVSEIFLLGILSYIFLEAAFLAAYAKEITIPTVRREEWLRSQLEMVKREAQRRERTAGRGVQTSTGLLGRLYTSDTFSIVRDLLEKRLFRREEKEDIEILHEVRRLNSYVDQLAQRDPTFMETLTARTALPRGQEVIRPIVIGTGIRLIILVVLAFFIMQPLFILGIIGVPIPVFESVEAITPEMSLIILLPLALTFPMFSMVIRRIVERRIKQQESREK